MHDLTPSLFDDIDFHARLHPSAPAVRYRGEDIPYRRFRDDVDRVSRHIAASGLQQGQRVAVSVLDSYLQWLAVLACNRLGLPTLSIDPAQPRPAGFAYLVDASAPARSDDDIVLKEDVLAQPLADWPALTARELQPDAACRFIDSSGTTGTPKRIAITYDQYRRRALHLIASYNLGRHTRGLSAMGLVTLGGFMFPMASWSVGGCVILRGHDLVRSVYQSRPTMVFTSPFTLREWLQATPPGWAASDMDIFVGGGALPDELNVQARLRLSPNVYMVYGSTEASSVSIAHAGDIVRRPGCVGFPVPYARVEIVDEAGQALPAGTEGIVRTRGPGMATGYDGDAPASELAFKDGWFYPGDTGKLDEQGRLYVLGRVTEVINAGGAKIAPESVDSALANFPALADVAAFAAPSAHGSELWLAAVGREGFDPEALVRRYMELYPRRSRPTVMQVKAIPRNAMGKVQRSALRELAERAIQAAATKH